MSNFKIKIEKDVPLKAKSISWPLNKMEVDDSFVFPISKRGSVQSLASRFKHSGKHFKVSKISETECRVWRTK